MKIIVDSSVLIDHLRGGYVGKKILKDISKDHDIYIPTIVLFELFSGKSTERAEVVLEIQKLIQPFERITLTESIAQRAGELYRNTKHKLGPADYIIAASALEINGSVATLNTKHFKLFPNLLVYPLSA